jgi:hypothetical protein
VIRRNLAWTPVILRYLILNALLPGASSLRRRGPDTEPGLAAQPQMQTPIVRRQPARRWSVMGGISLTTAGSPNTYAAGCGVARPNVARSVAILSQR